LDTAATLKNGWILFKFKRKYQKNCICKQIMLEVILVDVWSQVSNFA